MRDYSVAAAFGLIMLALIFSISVLPRQGENVAVVVSPWTRSGAILEIIAKADGSIVRQGKWPWILVARSDTANFVNRLYSAGALVVLDPVALGACIRF